MKHADFEQLFAVVIKESGAHGWTRSDLRRELESHVWEAVRALQEHGVPDADIPALVVQRFGSPEIIGKQLSTMHGTLRIALKAAAATVAVLVAFVILYPLEGDAAYHRYREAVTKRFLDVGWYERSVELAAEANTSEHTYDVDGINNRAIPAGNILTFRHSKWLVIKFLPPMQLTGPRITQQQVYETMRMEGGLSSVDAVFGNENVEFYAQSTLEQFLHALAVGAGNAPTVDMLAGNIDEPKEMGEEADRQWSFAEAASLWGGNTNQLIEWNSDRSEADDAATLWRIACERQLLCYPVRNITMVSLSESDSHVVATLEAVIDAEDTDSVLYTFTVTRFEAGYPYDWTDDVWRVTDGYAMME